MTIHDFSQLILSVFILLILAKPLGNYIAHVYEGKSCWLSQLFYPLEHFIYRICGINPKQEMCWKQYYSAMFFLTVSSFFLLYLMQYLPDNSSFNLQNFIVLPPVLAFHAVASLITNTQGLVYPEDKVFNYFTQITGLTVQNVLSAATGMALLIAIIRGLVRQHPSYLGNFWVDLVRGTLYILLPLSLFLLLTFSLASINPFLEILVFFLLPTAFYYTFDCMMHHTRKKTDVFFILFMPLSILFLTEMGSGIVMLMFRLWISFSVLALVNFRK